VTKRRTGSLLLRPQSSLASTSATSVRRAAPGAYQVLSWSTALHGTEELFLRFRDIVQTPAFEEWSPRIYTANGRESITLSNGSRIKFIAWSKHSGRGLAPTRSFWTRRWC
jgi:hypothetical protein